MTHTLIGLVGNHVEPLYELYHQYKPKNLVLFYSQNTQKPMQLLTNQLAKDGFKDVQTFSIQAFELNTITLQIAEKLAKFKLDELPPKEVVCDVTGGTKPMSIALFNYAKQHNYNYTYVIGAIQQIDHSKDGLVPIEVKLSVKQFFGIKGIKIKESFLEVSQPSILSDYIFDTYLSIIKKAQNEFQKPAFLPEVRKRIYEKSSIIQDAGKAMGSNTDYNNWALKNAKLALGKDLTMIFDKSQSLYRVKLAEELDELWIVDEVITFLSGTWFEDYIFAKFAKTQLFDDLVMNLTTEYKSLNKIKKEELVKNEMDIVATKQGKLFLFEIKSGSGSFIGQDTINKLHSLRLGVEDKLILISLYPLKPEMIEKAKEKHIYLICLLDDHLESKIQELVNS